MRIARSTSSESSIVIKRKTGMPNSESASCRWISTITRLPRSFSKRRIICKRAASSIRWRTIGINARKIKKSQNNCESSASIPAEIIPVAIGSHRTTFFGIRFSPLCECGGTNEAGQFLTRSETAVFTLGILAES
jgi:hypothetical protein